MFGVRSVGVLVACIGAGAFNPAAAADLTVTANAHYFQGWTFNVSNNPRGCQNADIIPSDGSIIGTLGPITYQVHAVGATTTAAPSTTGWLDCRWPTFGIDIPVGNDQPAPIDTSHNRTGTFRFDFSSPLPSGTTLFTQDTDGTEASQIFFRSCYGTPVDASAFDFLRVSDPSLSSPVRTVIPAHTPGAAYWRIAALAASPAYGGISAPYYGSTNETVGIIIRSADVCQIEMVNTQENANGALSAGHHFYLGVPPNVTWPVRPAPAAVPALGMGALAALGALLAACASGLGRRSRDRA